MSSVKGVGSSSPDFGEPDLVEDYYDDYGEGFEEEDFLAMGIDPTLPTLAKPGSEEKVMMLAARYAAGLPLWHQDDCYDHGPRRSQDDDAYMDMDEMSEEMDDEDF